MLAPDHEVASEQWGFEDPRAVWVDELDRWVVTCTAYGPAGPAVFLATTEDFRSVERYGIVRHPEDKNAALLPHRIDGRWVLLHRPMTQFGGAHGEILLSRSDDLVSWSAPEQVLQPRAGAWWDSLRIGIGPPPLRTEHGWLLVYHGVKQTVAGDIYRVGLALLDLDEPTHVLHRLPGWVMAPVAPYERIGDVPNVVFPCGLVHDPASDDVAPVLRRRRQLHMPRNRAPRRPARRRARRAGNRREGQEMSLDVTPAANEPWRAVLAPHMTPPATTYAARRGDVGRRVSGADGRDSSSPSGPRHLIVSTWRFPRPDP